MKERDDILIHSVRRPAFDDRLSVWAQGNQIQINSGANCYDFPAHGRVSGESAQEIPLSTTDAKRLAAEGWIIDAGRRPKADERQRVRTIRNRLSEGFTPEVRFWAGLVHPPHPESGRGDPWELFLLREQNMGDRLDTDLMDALLWPRLVFKMLDPAVEFAPTDFASVEERQSGQPPSKLRIQDIRPAEWRPVFGRWRERGVELSYESVRAAVLGLEPERVPPRPVWTRPWSRSETEGYSALDFLNPETQAAAEGYLGQWPDTPPVLAAGINRYRALERLARALDAPPEALSQLTTCRGLAELNALRNRLKSLGELVASAESTLGHLGWKVGADGKLRALQPKRGAPTLLVTATIGRLDLYLSSVTKSTLRIAEMAREIQALLGPFFAEDEIRLKRIENVLTTGRRARRSVGAHQPPKLRPPI